MPRGDVGVMPISKADLGDNFDKAGNRGLPDPTILSYGSNFDSLLIVS